MAEEKSFIIKIQTDAELQGLTQTLKELEAVAQAARQAGRSTAEFDQEIKSLRRQIGERTLDIYQQGLEQTSKTSEEASKNLDRLNKSVPRGVFAKMGEELKGLLDKIPGVGAFTRMLNGSTLWAGLGLGAGGALFAGLKRSIAEFDKIQSSVIRLERTLANFGQMTPQYSAFLQDLAGTISEETATAGEEWIDVLTRLTAAGANRGNIEQYATAVRNLAGILNGDINQAGMVFQRAMMGNYDQVSRLGIAFTATGDKTKDLNAFMEAVAQQGGGLLEDRLQTVSGKAARLSEAIGAVFEGIGNFVSQTGIVQDSLEGLGDILEAFSSMLPKTANGLRGIETRLIRMPPLTEAARREVEELAKTQLEQLYKSTDRANSALQEQLNLLRQETQARLAMEDIQLAMEMERIDNDDSLTNLQKLEQKAAAQERSEQRKLEIRRKQNDEEQQAAQATIDNLNKEAADVERKIAQLEKQKADAKAAFDAVKAENPDLLDNRILEKEQAYHEAQERADVLVKSSYATGSPDMAMAARSFQIQADEIKRELDKYREMKKKGEALYSEDPEKQEKQAAEVAKAGKSYAEAEVRIAKTREEEETRRKKTEVEIEQQNKQLAQLKQERRLMDDMAALQEKQRAQTHTYAVRGENRRLERARVQNVDLPRAQGQSQQDPQSAAKILPGLLKEVTPQSYENSKAARSIGTLKAATANAAQDGSVSEQEMATLLSVAKSAAGNVSLRNKELIENYISALEQMLSDLSQANAQVTNLKNQMNNSRS